MKSRSASRERKVFKTARARVRGSRTLTIGWRGHERGFCAELVVVVVGAAQTVSYVLNFVAIAKTARAPTQIGRHHHYGIHVWPIAMVTCGRVRESTVGFAVRRSHRSCRAVGLLSLPCWPEGLPRRRWPLPRELAMLSIDA